MASLKYSTILSLIALLSLFHFQPSNADVRGGYFPEYGALRSSDIDTTLFTHLFCAFAQVNPQTNQLTIPSGCSSFPQTVKGKNPQIKALLSIGGGDPGAPTQNLKAMASNPSSRNAFIQSSINVALNNGFDGLDLDWEHQSTAQEMTNLGLLLTEWRTALKANPSSQGLLLTAALRYTATTGTGSSGIPFPAKEIKENLDWVNLMAYDFYGPWVSGPYFAWPNAALRGMEASGENGVNAWINAGVPANQLVLGLPFYGYAWELVNANNNRIGAPSTGPNTQFGINGVSYKDIQTFIANTGAVARYNSTYVTGYCFSGTTWIGFDGPLTIRDKVLYAKNDASLLGYFSWNIDQDRNWALSKQASQTWISMGNQELAKSM